MTERLKLVQGDTLPTLIYTLTDAQTGAVVDLTGASVRLLLRPSGSAAAPASLAGILMDDPPGALGRVMIPLAASLATPCAFEGELEVTFPEGGVQTVYDLQHLYIRAAL